MKNKSPVLDWFVIFQIPPYYMGGYEFESAREKAENDKMKAIFITRA